MALTLASRSLFEMYARQQVPKEPSRLLFQSLEARKEMRASQMHKAQSLQTAAAAPAAPVKARADEAPSPAQQAAPAVDDSAASDEEDDEKGDGGEPAVLTAGAEEREADGGDGDEAPV
jgi:hypothetical protein